MDEFIIKYAKENDVDYYDPEKCEIYKVKEYKEAKKLGVSNIPGIEVISLIDGKHIRYVPEK